MLFTLRGDDTNNIVRSTIAKINPQELIDIQFLCTEDQRLGSNPHHGRVDLLSHCRNVQHINIQKQDGSSWTDFCVPVNRVTTDDSDSLPDTTDQDCNCKV